MKLLRMIFQVAFEEGTTTSYALASSQERGQMFVSPGLDVYKGQIVGIHQRPGDLSLNVCKKKAATNVRSNKEQTGENNSITSIIFLMFRLEFYLRFNSSLKIDIALRILLTCHHYKLLSQGTGTINQILFVYQKQCLIT